MNEKKLKKILKDAVTNEKIKTGTKEVLQSLKGTNLILTSTSLPGYSMDKVKKLSKESNIPLYEYPGNSVLLGRLCSLSYRASVISLKNVSEEDINSVLNDQ